jgi:hypothetical protein
VPGPERPRPGCAPADAPRAPCGWSWWRAALVAGCGGLAASPRSPIGDQAAAIAGLEAAYTPSEVLACLETAVEAQRACRDRIAQAMMVAVDLRYADYELGMFDAHRYGGFAATLGILGLTTAASVSGAAQARLLAALATGVAGAREAFEREVLAERTVVALQTAMQARRNEVGARIRRGLQFDAAVYPLGSALADLFAYFRAGTLVGAVVGLGEAAGDQAQRSRERLDDLVGLPPVRPPPPVAGAPPLPPAPQPAPVGGAPPGLPPVAGAPILGRGFSMRPAAVALRGWVDAGGPAAAAARRRQIACHAEQLGLSGINVSVFLRDDSGPAVETQREQVLARLRAGAAPCGGMN